MLAETAPKISALQEARQFIFLYNTRELPYHLCPVRTSLCVTNLRSGSRCNGNPFEGRERALIFPTERLCRTPNTVRGAGLLFDYEYACSAIW